MSNCNDGSGHKWRTFDGSRERCVFCPATRIELPKIPETPRPETFKQDGKEIETGRFYQVSGSYRPSAVYCPEFHRMQWYSEPERGEVVICLVRDCGFFGVKYFPVYPVVDLVAVEDPEPVEDLTPAEIAALYPEGAN